MQISQNIVQKKELNPLRVVSLVDAFYFYFFFKKSQVEQKKNRNLKVKENRTIYISIFMSMHNYNL